MTFIILSELILELKGVKFCVKQVQLYCCSVDRALVLSHIDYFELGSIQLYIIRYGTKAFIIFWTELSPGLDNWLCNSSN